ncbi:citrate synthase/methylcitrate synthase [Nitrospinae bacterium AH_259_B05_G02_I21]|nr:citrate synthase/methylcitrate synthase [Nitrospinae bacterium AH_259_B05_G02_I21]MDA2932402.1 citrate synthase/methylcitrate synthase [Nitrospinae bacterium AH-259-F20]
MAQKAAEKAPAFFGQQEYAKGLDGVIACETHINYIDGAAGKMIYRGYDVEEIGEQTNYEETAYLLIYGKLPTQSELDDFTAKLISYRSVPPEVIQVLKIIPTAKTHPMSALRTGVSALGTFNPDAEEQSVENYEDIGLQLIAKLATIAGAVQRIRAGKEPVEPDPSLDHSANFCYMMTGEKPSEVFEKMMGLSLVLHADHGVNASTFSSMVVISSLTDMYSAIAAGIGSLKGPLHGGANEQVLYMLNEIGSADKADEYMDNAIKNKVKIMGFGHRVYKAYDPRARIFALHSKELCEAAGKPELYEIAKRVEEKVIDAYGAKGIFPNVDFYSGTIYHCLGIETAMFTPLFAVSRVAGWVARILEYLPQNRIFRPRAVYLGEKDLQYVPIDQR